MKREEVKEMEGGGLSEGKGEGRIDGLKEEMSRITF